MTCDPTIATCPTAPVSDVDPLLFYGPEEAALECPTDPVLLEPIPVYPVTGQQATAAIHPLFRGDSENVCRETPSSERLHSPNPDIDRFLAGLEPGRTYRVSELASFPPEMAAIALALRCNPLASFRVSSVMAAEGVSVPQFSFFESAPNAASPGARVATGGGGGPTGGGSVGISLGFAGAVAGVLLLDRGLIRPLVENGTLPPELYSPALFTSASVTTLALERAGLLPRGTLATGFNHMGGIIGFQTIASIVLHETGREDLRAGTFGNQAASLTLAMLPYAYAHLSPAAARVMGVNIGVRLAEGTTVTLANGTVATIRAVEAGEAIGASLTPQMGARLATRVTATLADGSTVVLGAGETVALSVGTRATVATTGEVITLTAAGIGARALTWGVRAVGAVGIALLMDPFAGVSEWAIEHAIGASDNRIYRLGDLARTVDVQENNAERFGDSGGFWTTALLGNLLKTGYGLRAMASDDFGGFYNGHIAEIENRYVSQSRDFETFMEFNLMRIVQERTVVRPDGTMTTDWDAIRADVRTLYQTEGQDGQGNAVATGHDYIEGHYRQIEQYTGDYASDADALRSLVSVDGGIGDLEGLQRHLRSRLTLEFLDGTREMNRRALELGLATRRADGTVIFNDVDETHLTPEQRTYLDGDGLLLSLRLVTLQQQLALFPS